ADEERENHACALRHAPRRRGRRLGELLEDEDTMHARRLKNAILVVAAGSGFVLGCELIVDFDRTKIPIEDSGAPIVDGSPVETGTDAAQEAGEAGPDAADAGNDGDAAADAPDGD